MDENSEARRQRRLGELEELFTAGEISAETFERATARLRERTEPDYSSDRGTSGVDS